MNRCLCGLAAILALISPQSAEAAGITGGVSRMGPASPSPSSAPPSSYGRSPRDFARGYEGNIPGDPWGREADFKARSYRLRHEPPAADASPPTAAAPLPPDVRHTPSLVIPRVPGESALPPDNTDTGAKHKTYHGIEQKRGPGGGR
ncbi:MAG: hypothetical protein LBH65_00835 [Desulfovibrio sp.]|jgi:hypothetical protein|nr:hypothetical protein [Desulfovibrio sp.]